jgi:hypothetical protein
MIDVRLTFMQTACFNFEETRGCGIVREAQGDLLGVDMFEMGVDAITGLELVNVLRTTRKQVLRSSYTSATRLVPVFRRPGEETVSGELLVEKYA